MVNKRAKHLFMSCSLRSSIPPLIDAKSTLTTLPVRTPDADPPIPGDILPCHSRRKGDAVDEEPQWVGQFRFDSIHEGDRLVYNTERGLAMGYPASQHIKPSD